MMNLKVVPSGYNTIAALIVQFLITFGLLTDADAEQVTIVIVGVISGVVTLYGIYRRLRANKASEESKK